MQTVFLLTLWLVGIVLEAAFFPHLNFKATPDLLLVAVILWGLLRGPWAGGRLGLVYGLAEGLFSGKYLGLLVVTMALTGYLVGLMQNRIYRDTPLAPALVVFGGTLFHEALRMVLAPLVGQPWVLTSGSAWLGIQVLAGLNNTLVALLLYPLTYQLALGRRIHSNY